MNRDRCVINELGTKSLDCISRPLRKGILTGFRGFLVCIIILMPLGCVKKTADSKTEEKQVLEKQVDIDSDKILKMTVEKIENCQIHCVFFNGRKLEREVFYVEMLSLVYE